MAGSGGRSPSDCAGELGQEPTGAACWADDGDLGWQLSTLMGPIQALEERFFPFFSVSPMESEKVEAM